MHLSMTDIQLRDALLAWLPAQHEHLLPDVVVMLAAALPPRIMADSLGALAERENGAVRRAVVDAAAAYFEADLDEVEEWAVPLLRRLASDPSETVRAAALAALSGIGGDA